VSNLTLSEFENKKDISPVQSTITWAELVIALSVPDRKDCTVATCAPNKADKCLHKFGPAFSATSYSAGTKRANNNVDQVYALILDQDHMTEEALAETLIKLGPYKRISYATHSDRPGDRCMRVVLALSEPVAGADWEQFWDAVTNTLGIPVDHQTKDVARLFFMPSRPSDADYFFESHEGAELDVRMILTLAPAPVPQVASSSTPSTYGPASQELLDYARKALQKIGPAIQGHGGNDLTRQVWGTLTNNLALTEHEAMPLALEWNATCLPPWDPSELFSGPMRSGQSWNQTYGGERDAVESPVIAKLRARAVGSSAAIPAIEELNKSYAWVESLGRVACFTYETITYQDVQTFSTTHNNQLIRIGDDETAKSLPLGTAWLKSPARRTYGQVGTWAPPRVAPERSLNMWTGFAVQPKQGNWSLMREHIRSIIADGIPTLDEYIVRWVAWMFQNPGLRAEAVVALRSTEGTGKGIFGNALGAIVGKTHSLHFSDPEDFLGKFNASLGSAVFVFADECMWPGHKALEGRFKRMITEPTIKIEGKGTNAYQADNCMHMLMSTNGTWVVPAGKDARRFVVTNVSEKRVGDKSYFHALTDETQNGGLEAMLFDLLGMPLHGWHPREIVDSAALREQKELSLDLQDRWIKALLDEGVLPGHRLQKHKNVSSLESLTDHAFGLHPALRGKGSDGLIPVLTSIGCVRWRSSKSRGWKFPELAEARATWEAKVKLRFKWPSQPDWNLDPTDEPISE